MQLTKFMRAVVLQRSATVVLLVLCGAGTGVAQDRSASAYITSVRDAGVGSYRAGKWGMVSVELTNPSESPVEVTSVLSFDRQSDVQFGRDIWIPPRTRRTTWYPVRAPEKAPAASRIWEVHSMLFDATADSETPIPARSGEMWSENLIPIGRDHLTGLIVDPDNSETIAQLIWAARLSRDYPKKFTQLWLNQLPQTAASMDGLDHLVIASDQVLADPSACTAIREWLYSGGHLWVMLDLVDPMLMSRLIGDALQLTTVDRIDRMKLQFYSHDGQKKLPSGDTVNFKHPITMVRALFSGFRVSHTIDDWPAAAWTSAGRGKLLVTTVAARGWIRPRNQLDPLPSRLEDSYDFAATESLKDVAYEFLAERERPPLESDDFEQVLSEQIGYRVVSRGRVAVFLGTFCLGLTALGIFLLKRGSLEHLGWLGTSVVVVTSVSLLGVGRASRETVPKMVAVTQFAETSPHTDEVQVTGLFALYSPEKRSASMSAHTGGIFWPNLMNQAGAVVRVISTDRDEWEIRNLLLPAGQQFVPFSYTYHLDQPVTAVGTFGPDGLRGVVAAGPFQQAADAILALPATRNVAVQLGEGGQFSSGSEDTLAPGQFLTGSVLSDEQRRRREVYRLMFNAGENELPYPSRPTLLFWSHPPDLGFQLLEGAEQTGSALVSVPLQLTRPEEGTRVVIPGPFVTYRSAGVKTAATYDWRKRRWSDPSSESMDTTLQFQLPAELLPLRLESATLTLDIKAPSRQLQITGMTGGERVVLESRQSPLGRMNFEIDGEDVRVNQAGELMLGINVGEAKDKDSSLLIDPSKAQFWQIDDVQLEVVGVVVSP